MNLFALFHQVFSRPLVFAYKTFESNQQTLRNAFLSTFCLAYVRQRSSCDQWSKEEFLSIKSIIPNSEENSGYKEMLYFDSIGNNICTKIRDLYKLYTTYLESTVIIQK